MRPYSNKTTKEITTVGKKSNKMKITIVLVLAQCFVSTLCAPVDKITSTKNVQWIDNDARGELENDIDNLIEPEGKRWDSPKFACCVFRTAFGCCAHPKAGRNIFLAVFNLFFLF